MKGTFLFLTLSLGILTLAVLGTNAQFWVDLGEGCAKDGVDILPGIIDPWVITVPCKTYNGSAGCFDGVCKCNQDTDAYFDSSLQICLGKVGAICSAEHSTIFPDKTCTPNADCVPIQGEGYSVGKCECLYGYVSNEEGRCVEDEAVEEGERSTQRSTTIAEPPERGPFTLPLNLLFGINTVSINSECQPKVLLNHTLCKTYSGTVSCQSKKCQCNMLEDSIFDDELDLCVGLVGTYCLARQFVLGYKVCTKNANCILDDDKTLEDGYSFGTCDCAYGYFETETGTCELDESIPSPSTQSTIVPPTTTTGEPTTTTLPPSAAPGIITSTGYLTTTLFIVAYVFNLL